MESSFSRKEEVAMLLLNLGPEVSADILGNLGETEIAEISDIMGKMRNVSDDISIKVLNEFKGEFQSWRKSEEITDVIKDNSILEPSYSGKEKVAILLLNLGPEAATDILGNFDENEIAEISDIIGKMKNINDDISIKVLKEFEEELPS